MAATIWGLDTGRPGEFMQVEILGRRLGLDFERIRLSAESKPLAALPVAPPGLILSFGRAAQAALRLAAACSPRPLLVHLGTPGHTAIAAFDLIIPMPQDDYPPAQNVCFLRLPLNGASEAVALPPARETGICTVIIGGPSRHFRMPRNAVRRLIGFGAELARANGEALQVVASPRTPAELLAQLAELRAETGFTLHAYGGTLFAEILQSGSRFVVTADSASMLAEACRTGAAVWLFPLPRRLGVSTLLQHGTDRLFGKNFRHRLVRLGWVGGGTDFRRWHGALEQLGFIRSAGHLAAEALRWAPAGERPDGDLRDCRARILAMLDAASRPGAGPAMPLPSGSDSVSRE